LIIYMPNKTFHNLQHFLKMKDATGVIMAKFPYKNGRIDNFLYEVKNDLSKYTRADLKYKHIQENAYPLLAYNGTPLMTQMGDNDSFMGWHEVNPKNFKINDKYEFPMAFLKK